MVNPLENTHEYNVVLRINYINIQQDYTKKKSTLFFPFENNNLGAYVFISRFLSKMVIISLKYSVQKYPKAIHGIKLNQK